MRLWRTIEKNNRSSRYACLTAKRARGSSRSQLKWFQESSSISSNGLLRCWTRKHLPWNSLQQVQAEPIATDHHITTILCTAKGAWAAFSLRSDILMRDWERWCVPWKVSPSPAPVKLGICLGYAPSFPLGFSWPNYYHTSLCNSIRKRRLRTAAFWIADWNSPWLWWASRSTLSQTLRQVHWQTAEQGASNSCVYDRTVRETSC